MSEGLTGALRAAGRITGLAATVVETIWRARAAARAGDEAEVRSAHARVLGAAAHRTLALHDVRIRAAGPLPARGALLVSNHVSYLDPVVIAAVVPCLPISKAELASWPILGAVARRTGVLFVDRGDAGSSLRVMRGAQRALASGLSILNFPEGTTTAGDEVLGFHRGLFAVARRAGAPVVPVAIAYDPPALAWTGDATFLPHYLRLAASPGAEVRVTFGAPMRAEGRPGDLAEAARDCIRAMLEEGPRWASRTR